jgi:hypothetical protein
MMILARELNWISVRMACHLVSIYLLPRKPSGIHTTGRESWVTHAERHIHGLMPGHIPNMKHHPCTPYAHSNTPYTVISISDKHELKR